MGNTILKIRVDYNTAAKEFMAVKDYGDDLGYLEEIGAGQTPTEAVKDLINRIERTGNLMSY